MKQRIVRGWIWVGVVGAGCDPSGGGLGPYDAGDVTSDGGAGTGSDAGAYPAVPGARCELTQRIGLIEIVGDSRDPLDRSVRAWVQKGVDPYMSEPLATTEACAFFAFDPVAACGGCEETKICSVSGACVEAPEIDRAATLTLTGTDGVIQTLSTASVTGAIYEDVTLATVAMSVEFSFQDHTVVLGPTAIPDSLAGARGTLDGSDMAPERLVVRWSPIVAAPPSAVFTHISINHHAAGPTFTECMVSAAAGTFTVPGDMLKPLAVATGLEFQGIDHVRIAAAETPDGCVEIRLKRQQRISTDPPVVH